MIEIKFQFVTIAEAARFLAAQTNETIASASITPEKQQAARDSTAAGKAAKAEKATPPAGDSKDAEAAAKAAAEALTKLRTEVSAKIVKLAGLNQDAAVTLLASFNVKRAKELADDQLTIALAAADKALATADMG